MKKSHPLAKYLFNYLKINNYLVPMATTGAIAAPIAAYEGTLTTNVNRFGQVAALGFGGIGVTRKRKPV